ncbi:methionyl-tRNA formyltransferase [Metamycoplasma buccale]|uniref:methionyl-tRNA formyltransferase n=1 Tax=Metamycoplasma buccale TaxID=55602 RepID=UPI00398E97A3
MKQNKIKLVLAGTGKFSSDIFSSLIRNDKFEVVCLISQPNKSLDRQKNIIKTEVSKLANDNNIKLFQPNKIGEIYDELKELDFDFFITAAFGQFIPNSIIKLAKKAALNIHGSILEKYRGAAPVQYALLNNEKETGISLIYMIDKMDAGDILATAKTEIKQNDTALEIFDKLASLTISNLPKWLEDLYNDKITSIKQNELLVSFAPKIKNEEVEIFKTMTCQEALNKIRAFNDQPGAYIIINNKRLKIYRATFNKIKSPLSLDFSDGKLYLIEYQFEGKKRVKHEI